MTVAPRSVPAKTLKGRKLLDGLRNNSLETRLRLAREEGDLLHCRFGRTDLFLVNHPDDIQRVLVQDRDLYSPEYLTVKRWLKKPKPTPPFGFLRQHGAAHLRARRLYSPAFAKARLSEKEPEITDMIEEFLAALPTGEVLDVMPLIRRLVTRMMTKVTYGQPLPLPIEQVVSHVDVCLYQSSRFTLTSPAQELVFKLRYPTLTRISAAFGGLEAAIAALVAERRRHPTDGGDVLSRLLAEQEKEGDVSDEDIAFDLMGVLFAGIDSTATAIGWSFNFLATDPALRDRVRAEAGDPDSPTLTALLHESLRLYPSTHIGRHALVEHQLGPYTVPAGASLWISPYVVHRDERWYAAPEQFRPERWLDGSLKGNPRLSFIPFGAGHRKCLGEPLAWREISLAVQAFAERFDSLVPSGLETTPNPRLAMQPASLSLLLSPA